MAEAEDSSRERARGRRWPSAFFGAGLSFFSFSFRALSRSSAPMCPSLARMKASTFAGAEPASARAELSEGAGGEGIE